MDEVVKLSWQLSGEPRRGAEGTRMIVMAQLTGAERPGRSRAPLSVSLVLDRSGSMEGAKLDHCKHAAGYAISQLTPKDQVSVVAFDNTIELLIPHQSVIDKQGLMTQIQPIVACGGTNLSGGWLHGATRVEKSTRPGQVNRLVLLTDGRPNDGATHPDSLVAIARDLRERGVQTTTVGVGADVDEDLLRALAQAGGGNFHFIESPEETSTIFAREFVELLTTVAQNVALRVIPAPGVKLVGFLQDLAVETVGDGQEVQLGDLLAGDQRNVLLEFLIPPGVAAGAVSALQLEYQQAVEPIGLRQQSTSVEAAADSVVKPAVWREVLLAPPPPMACIPVSPTWWSYLAPRGGVVARPASRSTRCRERPRFRWAPAAILCAPISSGLGNRYPQAQVLRPWQLSKGPQPPSWSWAKPVATPNWWS